MKKALFISTTWGTFLFALLAIIPVTGGCNQPLISLTTDNHVLLEKEAAMHQRINQIRDSLDLPQLQWNSSLASIARAHSMRMALGRIGLDHDLFKAREEEIRNILPLITMGENLAYSGERPDQIELLAQMWMDSPSHHEILVGDYNQTGIGAWQTKTGRTYYTQIFVLADDVIAMEE